MNKKKILFLCSGSGGSMIFVDQVTRKINTPFKVIGVIADRECDAVEYCKERGLSTYVFKPWREKTDEIIGCIRKQEPDIVVTNISKILPEEIFHCCNALFINLHWSLLPAFGGVIGFKTLELAKQSNSKIIGATCHYVTEVLDGGSIISQGAMPVDWNDDIEEISKKVFRIACKVLLNGIFTILDLYEQHSSSDGFMYSPQLSFDDSFIDDSFWNLTIYKKGK